MGDETVDRLLEYTRHYHAHLSGKLASLRPDVLPHHGAATEIVALIQGSDGYAVFYLPVPDDPTIQKGYHVYDFRKYDLNRICQSVSVNRLQMAPPLIGEAWDKIPPFFAVTEPIPELNVPWIHDDLRAAAISGDITSLPGMTISPIIHIENGIRTHVVAARVKVWAPVFPIPGIGPRRLYLWTHADFWWMPERLELGIDAATQAAEADAFVLQMLSTSVPILTPELARFDASTHAADILVKYCDELLALVDVSGDKEETLHQWLNDPRHRIFLDPHIQEFWSKLPFGDRVSDFVVRRPDITYKLIEIERGDLRIFTRSKSEPSADFNHACQQVRDWKRYIRDNVLTVRTELGLDGIDNPDGMVVMGRSRDIDSEIARKRWRDLKATNEFELFTYDELCDSVRAIAASLRKMLRAD